jgi:hypothetical protein
MATATPAGTIYSSGVIVGPRSKKSAYQQGVSTFSRDQYNRNLAALGNPKASTPEGAQAIAAAYNVAKNQSSIGSAGQGAGTPPPRSAVSGGGTKKSSGGSRGYSYSRGRGGGGGGGGGRRGGGGGGGGGGGNSAAAAAQAQMDYLTGLFGAKNFTAPRDDAAYAANQALRDRITAATAADQQAATGAYNNLDTYLQGNQTNPYANVQIQRAATAPSYNPYLQSQGIAGSAPMASNPDDGGYAAFQNVLALLGANQQANNASGLRASQEARTYAGQQIGGLDNAYLANVDTRDAQLAAAQQQQQMQLDTERRAGLAQLAALIAQGAKAPDLAALGLA